MIPITLVPENFKILLAGKGTCYDKRLKMLFEAGLENSLVQIDGIPSISEVERFDVIYLAGLEKEQCKPIYDFAISNKKLINVEDVPEQCNFHVPARVRRGKLLITISTGGASPRLSARIRRILENLFDESWDKKLEIISKKRTAWKQAKKSMSEVAQLTDQEINSTNLFENFCDKCRKF